MQLKLLFLAVGLTSVFAEVHPIHARAAAAEQYLQAREAFLDAREAYIQAADAAPVSAELFPNHSVH